MKTSLGRKSKESWQKAEERLSQGTAGLLGVESRGARGQSTGRAGSGGGRPRQASGAGCSAAVRGGAVVIEPGEISSWSGLKDLSAQVKLKQDRRNIPGGEWGLGLGRQDKSKQ